MSACFFDFGIIIPSVDHEEKSVVAAGCCRDSSRVTSRIDVPCCIEFGKNPVDHNEKIEAATRRLWIIQEAAVVVKCSFTGLS